MKKKLLLSGEQTKYEAKDIGIFEHPELLKSLLNRLSWRILTLLGEREMYPIEIAKKLGVHEQKVYYHIRKLTEAEVIKELELAGFTSVRTISHEKDSTIITRKMAST